jgi:hypothetical protein
LANHVTLGEARQGKVMRESVVTGPLPGQK